MKTKDNIAMTNYRYHTLDRREKRDYYTVSIVLLLILGMLFYQNIFISILLCFFSVPGRRLYEKSMADKKRKELNAQFKDLLYSLAASFQSGRQMREALKEGLYNLELIYENDSPIIVELENIIKGLEVSRESEETMLYDFAHRSASEDIMDFVDVYFTCRTTGGDIQKVILKASDTIIDKFNIEKEIMTITSQKKFEAKILLLIPLIILFILQLSSPEYISILYETPAGRLLMTISLVITGISYFWSMKITDISI